MEEIRFTRLAAEDLEAVWFHVAQGNPIMADRYIERFWEVFAQLLRFPHMGRDRSDLRPFYRSFPHGSYLIYYVKIREGIEIKRVLHGARDTGATFGAEDETDQAE